MATERVSYKTGSQENLTRGHLSDAIIKVGLAGFTIYVNEMSSPEFERTRMYAAALNHPQSEQERQMRLVNLMVETPEHIRPLLEDGMTLEEIKLALCFVPNLIERMPPKDEAKEFADENDRKAFTDDDIACAAILMAGLDEMSGYVSDDLTFKIQFWNEVCVPSLYRGRVDTDKYSVNRALVWKYKLAKSGF